MVELYISHGQT